MKKLLRNNYLLFLTPTVLLLVSFVFPFIFWPEMLNWPFIMSRGWLPYRDFSMIYTPILPVLLMFFYKLVGFSPVALRIFGALLLFLANFTTVLLVRKLIKSWPLVIAAGVIHGLLSLTFEGNTVWFESLLTPMLIMAFWLQLDFLLRRRLWKVFISGILMGLVFLTKQTALFILPEFAIFLFYLRIKLNFRWRKLWRVVLVFTVPIVISGLIFFGFLIFLNIFPDFINWAVKFVFLLTSMNSAEVPSVVVLPMLRQKLMLLVFFLVTVYLTWRLKSFKAFFIFCWIWLAFLFIIPRFEYFHLLPMLPFFVALIFLAIKSGRKAVVVLLLIGVFVLPILRNTLLIGSRFYDREVISISAWLSENFPDASIFSLNGPDLVYFLAKRPPAVRPWIDQLPWLMSFAGENFVAAFKKSNPEIIVFRPYLIKPVNGLGAYQPKEIVEFVNENYHLINTFSGGVQILKRND